MAQIFADACIGYGIALCIIPAVKLVGLLLKDLFRLPFSDHP